MVSSDRSPPPRPPKRQLGTQKAKGMRRRNSAGPAAPPLPVQDTQPAAPRVPQSAAPAHTCTVWRRPWGRVTGLLCKCTGFAQGHVGSLAAWAEQCALVLSGPAGRTVPGRAVLRGGGTRGPGAVDRRARRRGEGPALCDFSPPHWVVWRRRGEQMQADLSLGCWLFFSEARLWVPAGRCGVFWVCSPTSISPSGIFPLHLLFSVEFVRCSEF
mmetsp:Transcript_56144/g.109916  ORF Transcript_56144/g.109916 Transcript_56144/m.109916 type:complete len:213 (+) Transcript_56144:231-869(+)